MKKALMSVLTVLLVLAMTLSVVVACTENEPETYTVTFKNGDDTVKTVQVNEGESLTAEQLPSDPTAPQGQKFDGWYVGETKVEAGYKPTGDVTATAKFVTVEDITGSGTKDDPYVIHTAQGLVTFAYNVNRPDVPETANWYQAYFELGADIDMTGVTDYVPAGSRTATLNGKADVYGFQGQFDGKGHTISNLTITQRVGREAYVGLFGFVANLAYIRNFNLENMTITLISGADTENIRAYVGAVAGYLQLSQADRISADVTVNMQWYASNTVLIGGIAGIIHSDRLGDGGAIIYAENLSANLNVNVQEFEEGDVSVLGEKAYIGGIFGEAYAATGSALALINVAATGTFNGGKYQGGVVAAAFGDNISFINCYADTTLKPTASESIVGGIVGVAQYDNTLMDCYAKTKAEAASDCTAGGIVGLGMEDLFEFEQVAQGTAVVNCHYTLVATGVTADKTYGTEMTGEFSKQFALDTLKWAEQSWSFENGKVVPTFVRACDINNSVYTVTFADGSSTTSKDYGKENYYETIRRLDPADNADNNVFWDWQFAGGVDYRFYLPVVKNITLTARRYDLSDFAGTYEGVNSYNSNQVGIIVLNANGTAQYVTSSSGTSVDGVWRCDGKHIIIETLDGDYLVGTIAPNGSGKNVIEYKKYENQSEVTYTFTEVEEMALLGEYFSADGDIITFSGTENITLILDGVDEPIRATYTQLGNTLTVTGKEVEDRYSSATIQITASGFTTNFVGKSGYADNKKDYTKLGAQDYSDQAFIGENNTLYMYADYQENRTITFAADGTLTSSFGSGTGRYYLFGTKVKIIIDSLVSTFTYDQTKGIMYGYINRGQTARCSTIIAPATDGALRGYIVDGERNNTLFVNEKGSYYVKNGVLQDVTVSGTFEDGTVVTIDGTSYIAQSGKYSNYYDVYTLTKVGAEYGDYTLEGKTLKIDGVGGVSGDFEGSYVLNGNNVVCYNFVTGEILAFDYVAAQAAQNVATSAANDGYRGIWFNDKADGSRYYVLVIDGLGQQNLFYLYDSETNEYHASYGNDWKSYTINSDGTVYTIYNDSQKPTYTFYYNKQLVVGYDAKSYTFGDGVVFYAPDYEGEKTAPTFDENLVGKYIGDGVELEIKSDLSGTLNGTEFKGRIDGNNILVFTVSDVEYTFNGDELTLSHDDVVVQLTAGKTEALDIVGTWKGTLSGSNGNFNGQPIELTFDGAGNVSLIAHNLSFTGKYTFADNKVSTSGWSDYNYEWEVSITITVKDGKLEVSLTLTQNSEWSYDFTATLTKEQSEEPVGSPVVGTWTGTLAGTGGLKEESVQIVFDETTVTVQLSDAYTFQATYTYNDKDGIVATGWDINNDYAVNAITLTLDNGQLKLSITIEDQTEWYTFTYTATLTKKSELNIVGTWSGVVTQTSPSFGDLTGNTITVEFTADGKITITLKEGMVYSGTYTYKDGVITADVSGVYDVTKIELVINGSEMDFKFELNDSDSMNDFRYSATLTK